MQKDNRQKSGPGTTSPSPGANRASPSRSPAYDGSRKPKSRKVGKYGKDYVKRGMQKLDPAGMRLNLMKNIPIHPPSIAPALTMLDMLGMPPHEVNQLLSKSLCEDIRSSLANMSQTNLVRCLRNKILETNPDKITYFELMGNRDFQSVVLEIISLIEPQNVNEEVAGLLRYVWDQGTLLPFLREMFLKIPLTTRQIVWEHNPQLLRDLVDRLFKQYCAESVRALRNNSHGNLNEFDSAAELAKSLKVNGDQDRGRKLYGIISDHLRRRFFETGNVYYGEFRAYLLLNLRKNDFPFRSRPPYENLLKALNALMDIEPSQSVNSKMKSVLESINDVLITDMGVANLPKDRIDRLTDKSLTSDLIITYKLQAPIVRKKKSKRVRANIAGGTLKLNRGKWEYTCRTFKNEAEGERITDIVANLKHPYHQEKIRSKMGRPLNIVMLTPEIMVKCNKAWFPDVWDKDERDLKLTKSKKLEDASRLDIPTDDVITGFMVPGGTLEGFPSLITRCQREILEKVILKASGGGFRGDTWFSDPVLPTYIPLRSEGQKFLNANSVDKLDPKYIAFCEKERKQYLDIIGGKPMCVSDIKKKVDEAPNAYENLPICAFLNDVNLIFDNCIRYWQWRETQDDREKNQGLIKFANNLKIKCYEAYIRLLQQFELFRESSAVRRELSKKHDIDVALKMKLSAAGKVKKSSGVSGGGASQLSVSVPLPVSSSSNSLKDTHNATKAEVPASVRPAPQPPTSSTTPIKVEEKSVAPISSLTSVSNVSTPTNKATIKSIKDADPEVLKKVMASTLLYMKNIDTHSVFHKSDVLFQLNKYTEYIERPLSFFEVEQLLNEGKYLTLESFLADMKLIFDNCINYHTSEHSKYDAKVKRTVVAKARKFHQHLQKQYSKILKKEGIVVPKQKILSTTNKTIVGLAAYNGASSQIKFAVRLTKNQRVEKCFNFLIGLKNDPYKKIFPRSTSERFWKQKVEEGRYFKNGIFTYADIKRKISQNEYENENAEQLFIDDMSRIYEDCMEYYKEYPNKEYNDIVRFAYLWAEYCKERLGGVVDSFLNRQPPFPGEDKKLESGDVIYKKMRDVLLTLCRKDSVRNGYLYFFSCPVSTKRFPQYTSYIEQPMDYLTIRRKVDSKSYEHPLAFIDDIALVFENALKFNHTNEVYRSFIQKELQVFNSMKFVMDIRRTKRKQIRKFPSTFSERDGMSHSGSRPRSRGNNSTFQKSLSNRSGSSGSRSASKSNDRSDNTHLKNPDMRRIMDILMTLSSPMIHRALCSALIHTYRLSMLGGSEETKEMDVEDSNSYAIRMFPSQSILGGTGMNVPSSKALTDAKAEQADDVRALREKCMFPSESTMLRQLARWICLSSSSSCIGNKGIRNSFFRDIVKSRKPVFCRSSIRLDNTSKNSGTNIVVDTVDSYDYILRNVLPCIGSAMLKSHVAKRMFIEKNILPQDFHFENWKNYLNKQTYFQCLARVESKRYDEEFCRQNGFYQSILNQFVMATMEHVLEGNVFFVKAALAQIVNNVDTNDLFDACFNEVLLSTLHSFSKACGIYESQMETAMVEAVVNSYFTPMLDKLEGEGVLSRYPGFLATVKQLKEYYSANTAVNEVMITGSERSSKKRKLSD